MEEFILKNKTLDELYLELKNKKDIIDTNTFKIRFMNFDLTYTSGNFRYTENNVTRIKFMSITIIKAIMNKYGCNEVEAVNIVFRKYRSKYPSTDYILSEIPNQFIYDNILITN
jgi:hypothetical protein